MDHKTLLFVCTGNYYRSRHAELYFNARAPSTMPWRALSRGFRPNPDNIGSIAQSVLDRFAQLKLSINSQQRPPIQLEEKDLLQAHHIIALDKAEHPPYVEKLFPNWKERITYWQVQDIDFMPVQDALLAIEHHVDELFEIL